MYYHLSKKEIINANVHKFRKRQDAYDYLEKEVFLKEDFSNHVKECAETNKVSYLLAYDLITNHLTDVLYEIDKSIITQEKKVKKINIYSYFSLHIGFMISSTKRLMNIKLKKRKYHGSKSK